MNKIVEIAKLDHDVTQEEGDALAMYMLDDPEFENPRNYKMIAEALINIGNYRVDGVGFSEEVSDTYANWIENVFDEAEADTAEKLAGAMFQLPSQEAYRVAKQLYSKVRNESVKALLSNAICYAGT